MIVVMEEDTTLIAPAEGNNGSSGGHARINYDVYIGSDED